MAELTMKADLMPLKRFLESMLELPRNTRLSTSTFRKKRGEEVRFHCE